MGPACTCWRVGIKDRRGELDPVWKGCIPSGDEEGQVPSVGGRTGSSEGEIGRWEGRVEKEDKRHHPSKGLAPAEPPISKKGGGNGDRGKLERPRTFAVP